MEVSRTGRSPKRQAARLSTLLLITALAGELICLVKTNRISGQLLGSLNVLANDAFSKASVAKDTSDIAKGQSADAAAQAKSAKLISEESGKKSDAAALSASSAVNLAKNVRSVAKSLQQDLALTSGQIKELRVETFRLQHELQSENFVVAELSNDVSARKVDPFLLKRELGRFSGKSVLVEWTYDLPEIVGLANQIATGLSFAGWLSPPYVPPNYLVTATPLKSLPVSAGDIFRQGVWILDSEVHKSTSGSKPAFPADALAEILTSEGLEVSLAGNGWVSAPAGVMVVLVGAKRPVQHSR